MCMYINWILSMMLVKIIYHKIHSFSSFSNMLSILHFLMNIIIFYHKQIHGFSTHIYLMICYSFFIASIIRNISKKKWKQLKQINNEKEKKYFSEIYWSESCESSKKCFIRGEQPHDFIHHWCKCKMNICEQEIKSRQYSTKWKRKEKI